MRILYFSRDYGTVTTTFIRNEVEYFASKNDCMYLCQRSFNKETPAFVKVLPFRENKIKWLLRKLKLSFNFHSKGYARKLKQLVKEFDPQIIHCHFVAEAFLLLDNIDYNKYPVFLHFHGYGASLATRNPFYVNKLKHLINQSNIFPVTCNNFFTESLPAMLQIPRERFFVLPYGIDTNLFCRKYFGQPQATKIFLQVSSLVEKKGHEYTIKAFALFLKRTGRKDCKLVIAGDGPLMPKLRRLTKKLALSEMVDFTGAIDHLRAVELLENANVFVHHSVTAANGDMEGMPNALIEAMAMKLPVISTFHSGIPELVEDKINGFLVEERNIDDYAEKMEKSLELGLLEANQAKVKAGFTSQIHNERLEKLYNQSLSRIS